MNDEKTRETHSKGKSRQRGENVVEGKTLKHKIGGKSNH